MNESGWYLLDAHENEIFLGEEEDNLIIIDRCKEILGPCDTRVWRKTVKECGRQEEFYFLIRDKVIGSVEYRSYVYSDIDC